jgi:hypothetical protein
MNRTTTYAGPQPDPAPEQRDDEFTVAIVDDMGNPVATPNPVPNPALPQWDPMNIAAAPALRNAAAGNFGFFFNQIVQGEIVVPDPDPDPDPLVDFDPFNYEGDADRIVPDDRTREDWQRELELFFTQFRPFGFRYEGFDRYGPNGEVIFSLLFGNTLELGADLEVLDPDGVLRRQQQILEEEEEEESEGAE